jgi:PAS domain S-box-containing protein
LLNCSAGNFTAAGIDTMSLFSRQRTSYADAARVSLPSEPAVPSLEQLQTVADNVPSLVSYVDANNRYRFANASYERWFGCTREAILGSTVREVIGEEAWRGSEHYVSAALGGASVHFEARLHYRNRGTRWVDCTYTPDVDASGRVRGMIACVNDITDRKELELQLLDNAAEQEDVAVALRESEARSRQLAEQLQAADQRKNEFLALLAHELRNPLAPLRNGLHLVRIAADAITRDRACAMMDRQLRHMVRLVDDLLDVSRITRSKLELRREVVELATVVRNAVEASGELIEAFDHELSVELPEEPVPLDADPVRMTQVVSNLLNNAAKYTNPGGRIEVRAWREGEEALILVRDSGIGIASEDLPRVFDLFSQVHGDPARAPGGLGVGLSLVRGLVQMHGGTVDARSGGRGRGSEFLVRLPVSTQMHPEETAAPVVEDSAVLPHATARPRRVLVVDDSEDNAHSLSQLLRSMNHRTEIAYDGPSAVEAAQRFVPEVVLLDIGLPGFDGYEVARRIRRAQGRDVRLIAITGWGQDGDKRRAWAAGFDAHLTKPVDPAALLSIVAATA